MEVNELGSLYGDQNRDGLLNVKLLEASGVDDGVGSGGCDDGVGVVVDVVGVEVSRSRSVVVVVISCCCY